MQDHDAIIVYREFSDGIEASLAKSKLDAFDIPCFLTEENMASLYPGQQVLPFRVRLHIFEKDRDAAAKILMESSANPNDLTCPRCGGPNIQRDFPKALQAKVLSALSVLFFGIFTPHKKVYHCLDCDWEF